MPTNPYYQEAFQGQAGQNAKAEQVKSEFDGVQSGFDAVLLVNQHAIAVPTSDPALNLLPTAASRANQWLRFDVNGQPILVSNPFNFRGAWNATTVYHVGDAFTAAPNGSTYYVTTQYTSGSSFGATDLANTSIMVNLGGLYFTTPQTVIGASGGSTIATVGGITYGLDSTAGNITVNLPTANVGDSPVSLTYLAGAASSVTVNSTGGQFINGNTQTQVIMDITTYSCSWQYWGSTYGWRVRTMG